MSEIVTVNTTGGTPTLSLNDGGTAAYVSGFGTSALTFSYTVQAGQNTPDLTETAVNLNGATITDGAGNAANLSLAGLSLGSPQIDTTTPTVSSLSESPSGGVLGIGKTVTFTLTLSEVVTVAGGTPTLTLNDGGTASYVSGSGTNALTFSYTVGAGQNTSSLAATAVNLNSATIADGAGNTANLSLSALSQSGPQVDIPVSQIDAACQAVLQHAPTTAQVSALLSEEATFGDAGMIAALVDSPEAQQNVYPVVQIIDLATGNLPTEGQLAAWVPATESGMSLDQMAKAFVASTAFGNIYNNGTAVDPNSPITASILEAIIQHATGVGATSEQLDAWVSSGQSVVQVFVDFALGEQYTIASESAVQQDLTTAADDAAGITGSSTLHATSPSLTTAQITEIYQAVLQRAPSGAEVNAVVAENSIIGNAGVVAVVVNSPEAQQNVYPVVQIIDLATGNLPTAAQLAGWVAATELGVSCDQMATMFVASTAFAETYNNGSPVDPNAPITASILEAIIHNATGVAATPAQVSAWVNSGQTVDQVFVDFALGDQYTTASQSTIEQYLTTAVDNEAGLSTINASDATGALTLGTTQAPLTGNDLTVLGGSGALTVVASGADDTVTELNTSTAGGTITANGAGDMINAANGVNTITANGAGDTINLGAVSTGTSMTSTQTIHAAGAGCVITFATTAADGTAVTWGGASSVDGGNSSIGIDANDTINFGNNTGSGSETVVVTGDLAGGTTSGGTSTTGIAMTTLTNVVDDHGDLIVFDNATTEVLAGTNAVNVTSAGSLARALDIAAAAAAASQSEGTLGADTGVIDWFQHDGNTYVLEAINTTSTAAPHGALTATDEVIKIIGLVNLSSESLVGHALTL